MAVTGGVPADPTYIQEVLDRVFNSFNFVGTLTGSMVCGEDGTWTITRAVLSFDGVSGEELEDGRHMVAEVLIAQGMRVRDIDA